MGEVIHLSIGDEGLSIGHEYLRDLALEHQIATDGTVSENDELVRAAGRHCYFYETKSGQYVSRFIGIDSDSSALNLLTQTPLIHLYNPYNLKFQNAVNTATYGDGLFAKETIAMTMDTLRRSLDFCETVSAVELSYEAYNGFSSGVGGQVLAEIRNNYPDVTIQSTLISQEATNGGLSSSYNVVMGLRDLHEHADIINHYDHVALQKVTDKQSIQARHPADLHNVVAFATSGLTSSFRFPGHQERMVWGGIATNLTPYPSLKLVTQACDPLNPHSKGAASSGVRFMLDNVLSKDARTSTVTNNARFLAGIFCFRTQFEFPALTKELRTLKLDKSEIEGPKHSNLEFRFPQWVPDNIKFVQCEVGHADIGDCLVAGMNTSGILGWLNYTAKRFDVPMRKGVGLHSFGHHEIERDELMEARNNLQGTIDAYIEVDTCSLLLERPQDDEQKGILEEISKLKVSQAPQGRPLPAYAFRSGVHAVVAGRRLQGGNKLRQ